MKIHAYSLIAALLLPFSAAFAQEQALPFVRIDRNPRTFAMAGAGAASPSGLGWTSFRNPAAIPFCSGTLDAGLAWQRWAPEGVFSNNLQLGTGVRLSDRFGFSVGGAYQMGEKNGSFRPSDAVVNLGAGFRFTKAFSAGANLRYASSSIDPQMDYSAFAVDFMLMYRPFPGLHLAAGLASVGSHVKADIGDPFPLPSSGVLAGSYRHSFSPDHALEGNLDLDVFFTGDVAVAVGAEYAFRNMIFARAGYHYGSAVAPLPSFVSVGVGARIASILLDFAFLTASDILGNTLTLGLGYGF